MTKAQKRKLEELKRKEREGALSFRETKHLAFLAKLKMLDSPSENKMLYGPQDVK